MDIVCPVKPGDNNEPLRYAIRSWEANLAYDRIWIVGCKPNWLTGVEFIEGNHAGYHANVYSNIRAACEHPDVADDILVMNDDIFVTQPVSPKVLYRGPLTEHLDLPRVRRSTWWKASLETTLVCLQAHGISDPISYELHTPLPAHKQRMAETLAMFQHVTPHNPPQWRTLYGNLHRIDGEQYPDVKAYEGSQLNTPYHSTTARSFPAFVERLDTMFPASHYEQAEAAPVPLRGTGYRPAGELGRGRVATVG